MPLPLIGAAYAALTALLVVALVPHAHGGLPGVVDDWALVANVSACCATLAWRALRGPNGRAEWALVAGGLFVYTSGLAIYNLWISGPDVSFPSIADYMWLSV